MKEHRAILEFKGLKAQVNHQDHLWIAWNLSSVGTKRMKGAGSERRLLVIMIRWNLRGDELLTQGAFHKNSSEVPKTLYSIKTKPGPGVPEPFSFSEKPTLTCELSSTFGKDGSYAVGHAENFHLISARGLIIRTFPLPKTLAQFSSPTMLSHKQFLRCVDKFHRFYPIRILSSAGMTMGL